jgi:hypothetical protein
VVGHGRVAHQTDRRWAVHFAVLYKHRPAQQARALAPRTQFLNQSDPVMGAQCHDATVDAMP